MNLQIDIDYELADKILVKSLKETLVSLKEDYDNPRFPGVFSNDPEEDRKEIKKLMKAIKKVLSWYE